jgi:hypothetical protein
LWSRPIHVFPTPFRAIAKPCYQDRKPTIKWNESEFHINTFIFMFFGFIMPTNILFSFLTKVTVVAAHILRVLTKPKEMFPHLSFLLSNIITASIMIDGWKNLGYEKAWLSLITSLFFKFAERNKENKEMKKWRQQKRNFFPILLCIKKSSISAVENMTWKYS